MTDHEAKAREIERVVDRWYSAEYPTSQARLTIQQRKRLVDALAEAPAPVVAGGEALEALRNFFNAVTRECGEQPDVPEWVQVRDLLAARPAGTTP